MLAQADQGIIVYGYFPAKTAMGISKKNLTAISCWVFCCKGQIWWHYNHKNAHQKFFLVVYQWCNNALQITLVKTNIKYTFNKVFKPSNCY